MLLAVKSWTAHIITAIEVEELDKELHCIVKNASQDMTKVRAEDDSFYSLSKTFGFPLQLSHYIES